MDKTWKNALVISLLVFVTLYIYDNVKSKLPKIETGA